MRRSVLLMGVAVVLAVAGATLGVGKPHASSSALPSGEIVFTRSVGGRPLSLYVMAPDGSHVQFFIRNASNAAVSKDRRRIAFVRAGAIWVMQRDGSGQRQLTHHPKSELNDAIDDTDPAWSPDGRVVYFSRQWAQDAALLFSVRADGGELRRLSRSRLACDRDPAPSPDGRLVVYVAVDNCSHGLGAEIAAMTNAGRPPAGLWWYKFDIQSAPYVYEPAWSPDGRQLAQATGDWINPGVGGYAGIWVSSSDGSPPRRVARPTRGRAGYSDLHSPAWSRDGTWIVFVRSYGDHGSPGDIWLARSDGTAARSLTHTQAAIDPVWLPPVR